MPLQAKPVAAFFLALSMTFVAACFFGLIAAMALPVFYVVKYDHGPTSSSGPAVTFAVYLTKACDVVSGDCDSLAMFWDRQNLHRKNGCDNTYVGGFAIVATFCVIVLPCLLLTMFLSVYAFVLSRRYAYEQQMHVQLASAALLFIATVAVAICNYSWCDPEYLHEAFSNTFYHGPAWGLMQGAWLVTAALSLAWLLGGMNWWRQYDHAPSCGCEACTACCLSCQRATGCEDCCAACNIGFRSCCAYACYDCVIRRRISQLPVPPPVPDPVAV